jgi:hypothetical protein
MPILSRVYEVECRYDVKRSVAIDLMHNDVTRLDAREECWS